PTLLGRLTDNAPTLPAPSPPPHPAAGRPVAQSVFLRGGSTAPGHGDRGAVRLTGARIGGQLDCTGAHLRNDSGPALTAGSLQVNQGTFLGERFTAIGGGDGVAVRLTKKRGGGAFRFAPARPEAGGGPPRGAR